MKLQPINKKAPITAEIIQKMVEKQTHLHADLKGLRIACICSLGFSGANWRTYRQVIFSMNMIMFAYLYRLQKMTYTGKETMYI